MRTIIGLGNPGDKYIRTRHNIGFVVLDKFAENKGLVWEMNKKFNSMVIKTNELLLVKPMTYMNNSGEAVSQILSYYKILQKKFGILAIKDLDLSEFVTVIHDDIDIDLGKYKISDNSRSAGHRGVESIIKHLKTKNFKRIRVGVRTGAMQKMPVEKFVLQRFSNEEEAHINEIIPEILTVI